MVQIYSKFMKITTNITNNGVKRQVDFQGATLPDGRSIEGILNENERLKEDIKGLENNLKESSSILTKLVPNKKIRDIVEVVLIISTIIGIILLF